MPIPASFFTSFSTLRFDNAADIDNWFVKHSGEDFISWFNTRVGGRGFWSRIGSRAAITIANDSMAHSRFSQLWNADSINAMFGSGTISLLQFLTLQSIVNNETGGRLLPLTEGVGNPGNPGIAYAFNKIPGLKKSYNTLAGNKTCFTLFNDSNYNNAFGKLPLATQLKNTTNAAWQGEVWPANTPTATKPEISGYVLEADFFKFRGRGFIQTTGRSNYQKLVEYVMAYTGDSSTLVTTKKSWGKLSADSGIIATMSTNADWDNLFQNGNCLVAGRAINLHDVAGGQYLEKVASANASTAMDAIFNMGKSISGSVAYATLFQNRVVQVINAL